MSGYRDGPAFPASTDDVFYRRSEPGGLTKREYMATAIMATIVVNLRNKTDAARSAVEGADALLLELSK